MPILKSTLSWILWPFLVGGGMTAVHAAVGRGFSPAMALVGLQVLTVLIVVLFERWMPEHPSWNIARGDVRTDALHMFVSGILISGLLRTLLFAVTPGFRLWPTSWPLPAQLVLALFIADLGSYTTHVVTHRVGWLWPLHAPHHSSRRLYWLNTSRMHPLDTSSTLVLSLLPLALLGIPPAVLALFDAFAIVHLMLQHSNVCLRHGVLNHFFATAEFHRWHHSSARALGDGNYASFLSLWDHLFGTFQMPRAAIKPDEVGLYDGTAVPDRWADQVRHPFKVWRYRAPGSP